MQFFTDKRKILVFALLILVGIGLILLGDKDDQRSDEVLEGVDMALSYKSELERTASSMCASLPEIEGARVNITFDSTVGMVYAKNSEGSYGGTYFSSGGDPLFLKYEFPQIVGCAVICTGTGTSYTSLEITRMLSAYLGIPTNRIYVGFGS